VKRALTLATLGATLALAAPAGATIVYVKNLASLKYKPSIWAVNDDGSGQHRLATGSTPRISPDGTQVTYTHVPASSKDYSYGLHVIPTTGGPSRTLLSRVNDTYNLAWSPDSKHVLAVAGPELGPYRLVLIDVATAARRTIATGAFNGVSFSPDGLNFVYGRGSTSRTYSEKSDLFTAPVAGGPSHAITSDRQSLYPVWGPQFIAFSRAVPRKDDAAASNVYRINPDGSGRAAITHDKVGRLLFGLVPTEFSADGSRLLTQFGGQDTSYAVAVDPLTGAERVLGPKAENGYGATAISKDGIDVLASTGGADPSNRGNVVTIPFSGGKAHVLIKNADLPDWDR
jgi:Tol biopolymer transport system component